MFMEPCQRFLTCNLYSLSLLSLTLCLGDDDDDNVDMVGVFTSVKTGYLIDLD